MKRRGFLVVLSGPSSAGKNTLLGAIMGRVPGMLYSISATTRKPRPGEQHGVDYFFLDDEEFARLKDSGGLLEWAEYCGNLYGTPRQFVEDALTAGNIVITDIDIQGAQQIKSSMPEAVGVFLMPPSLEELQKRIIARGTDSAAAIKERMTRAVDEMKYVVDYDYWILNADLDQAVTEFLAIITAERQRVSRTDFS
jgi:guanylate kinase